MMGATIMDKILDVSQAAREIGYSATWLRRAEKLGRIPQARRNLNGWRVYTQEDIEILKKLLVPAKTD